nr:reverse transcriptase domain-containing protein [Tanacetum cinerariifolium]
MDECLALADLGASINLMPLFVWNKLSFSELSPTYMTLELADRLISRPVGVAEDVYVKVGTFYFFADFIVVDFDADPRVLLILRRSFLKTERSLIDVYEGELTICIGKEAVTFNLDQTSRYSANYDAMSVNQIDLIDVAYEEYSQEVLGFSVSGNPTPSTKPIVLTSSPTLTPFGDSDFLLEETDAFLVIDNEPISSKIDDCYYDLEGDILLIEEFLNDDPSSPPLHPQELKVVKPTNEKSSFDEPPMVKLKDLPPHLEYVFLEVDDKLLVIIAKDLKVEEKTVLIKVLKSHKQALAWKLFDIKGIDPEFRTHKILMEMTSNQWFNTKEGLIQKSMRTFAYRRMPLGLCNAPGTFQRCMMAIFHDMIEKTIEVFMDDFLVFGNSFGTCLFHLDKMLKRCEDTNLCLNWEKSHFMVNEGIILDHKIYKNGIEVMLKYDVTHHLAIAYHPQTSGQVKVSNRGLKRILERNVGENRASWLDKLDDAI